MDRILNLATYYLLPLVELSESSFGDEEALSKGKSITTDSNFVNCYLTNENYIAVEVETTDLVPSELFDSSYFFTDFQRDDTTILLFRVSGAFKKDLELFRSGKYSQFSEQAKSRIMIFNGFTEKVDLIKVLYRDKGLREQLEKKYAITLSEEAEVKSIPNESNFIEFIIKPQLENHD